MNYKDIIIVGGFHEMIELAEYCGYNIVGLIDNKLHQDGLQEYLGYPILGTDDDASVIRKKYKSTSLVVTPNKPQVKKKLVEYYRSYGFHFTSLISPYSKISPRATIGEGVLVHNYTIIDPFAKVGDFVRLESFGLIGHDCIIGDYSFIAAGAHVLGRVEVGECCYIGANSVIIPDHKIGDNVTVGLGSSVLTNVKSNTTVIGVPAKKMALPKP